MPTTLSRAEATASIRRRRLMVKRDWLGDFVGLQHWFVLCVVGTMLAYDNAYDIRRASVPILLVSGPFLLYGLYCLRHERDLTKVETGLNAAANRSLMKLSFDKLGWPVVQNTQQLVVANIPHKWYGFVGQTATALIQDDFVYLNCTTAVLGAGRRFLLALIKKS